MKIPTIKIVYSALFIAIGIVLPFLTGQIPEIGSMLLPMHIPVLLCGYILGAPYGLLVGFITPILRSLILTMPPMFPTAIAMAFELSTYGLVSGLMFKIFPKNLLFIIIDLLIAMVAGRIVWGLIMYILLSINDNAFTFQAFLSGALLKAFPGIILQLILIPMLVISLLKSGIIDKTLNSIKHTEEQLT